MTLLAVAPRPAAGQTPRDTLARRDSAALLRGVTVVGTRARARRAPGSLAVVEQATLERTGARTVADALRRVPGVHVREEEGLGLRPNIGIRGLSPTRSTKVLLLEDGIPLAMAPYGDNAAYYHPSLDRMARVEVVKGAAQVLHGPQTVGGVINFITPTLGPVAEGTVVVDGGSREARAVRARHAVPIRGGGIVADLGYRHGAGARENARSAVTDGSLKLVTPLPAGQSLEARATAYHERSQQTYSGLTEAEWAADPRQNQFRFDAFDVARLGGGVLHRARAGRAAITTRGYGHVVQRDWWRQSSNSSQRPNDVSDPACGGMANLASGCGNEGRLRHYRVAGLEPRVELPLRLGRVAAALDAGARLHVELQERRQLNGAAHDSRASGPAGNPGSGLVEDNRRTTRALAAFAQLRFPVGALEFTPGVRLEHVAMTRRNRLAASGGGDGVSGGATQRVFIPGLGVSAEASRTVTLFGGVHRGFAPSRPEDLIDNASGRVLELAPELSWNWEAGGRWRPRAGLEVEATSFHLAFANQVIPASVAGGAGATVTSAGRTVHTGLEAEARLTRAGRGAWVPFASVAATWLPVARFADDRQVFIGAGAGDVAGKVYATQSAAGTRRPLGVRGRRLPYAPRALATVTLGVLHAAGWDASVSAVHTGAQFGDAANTRATVPDGQQGVLPAATVWQASAQWAPRRGPFTVFGSVHNLTDALVLVDRTRGMLPGMPRTVRVGMRRGF